MNSSIRSEQLLQNVIAIARRAGTVVLDVYGTDFSVRNKDDASPVTEADEKSEQLIVPALRTLTPDVPIISEEAPSAEYAVGVPRFWLVDPLDGTKEFVNRNGEFTVNIALIENGRPTLGVVLAPALDRLFAGAMDLGAFVEEGGQRRAIACRAVPVEGLTVVSSRSHGDTEALKAYLGDRRIASFANVGSSLKFCIVAAGDADIYPRLGRTMEWDTAAGHAVLTAAGGRVTQLSGEELTYGKPTFANPHFVASGQPL